MIKSFKHKGLLIFWEKDITKHLPPAQVKRIRIILQIIDELNDVPKDLANLISLRPHLLKGNLYGFWGLDVTGNYRIIFKFKNGDAYEVDYLDTH